MEEIVGLLSFAVLQLLAMEPQPSDSKDEATKPALASASDLPSAPSYVPNADEKLFGCAHYQRASFKRGPCCAKFYPCRFCHDEATGHQINRHHVFEMICSFCLATDPTNAKPQPGALPQRKRSLNLLLHSPAKLREMQQRARALLLWRLQAVRSAPF